MNFKFFIATLTFASSIVSMNHPEAVQRCETRVNLLKGQTERVADPIFRDSLKKIMNDMDQVLIKLKSVKTAQDIFALSNECHNGARSAEWMVERYGKVIPSGLQNASTQKPFDQTPPVESLLTNTVIETQKSTEKVEKAFPEKKASPKKTRKIKTIKTKHRPTKQTRKAKSSLVNA